MLWSWRESNLLYLSIRNQQVIFITKRQSNAKSNDTSYLINTSNLIMQKYEKWRNFQRKLSRYLFHSKEIHSFAVSLCRIWTRQCLISLPSLMTQQPLRTLEWSLYKSVDSKGGQVQITHTIDTNSVGCFFMPYLFLQQLLQWYSWKNNNKVVMYHATK